MPAVNINGSGVATVTRTLEVRQFDIQVENDQNEVILEMTGPNKMWFPKYFNDGRQATLEDAVIDKLAKLIAGVY